MTLLLSLFLLLVDVAGVPVVVVRVLVDINVFVAVVAVVVVVVWCCWFFVVVVVVMFTVVGVDICAVLALHGRLCCCRCCCY